MSLAAAGLQAAPSGGLCVLGVPLVLLDSITESGPQHRGAVLVTGSHAGLSVVRYTLASRSLLAVFNDAGVGKDQAGIAALAGGRAGVGAAGGGGAGTAGAGAAVGRASRRLCTKGGGGDSE